MKTLSPPTLPRFSQLLGLTAFAATLCLATTVGAQDRAVYQRRPDDPVLRELRKRAKDLRARTRKQTEAIDKRHAKAKKEKRKARRALLFDLAGVAIPPSTAVFKRIFHFPPVAQFRTGTCWAFASTSFAESEVARLTGKRIKLSEMHTVYYEYLDKARRWLRERGHSEFSEGSENNAILRIFKRYGAVPRSAYRGIVGKDGRYDHAELVRELRAYLRHVKRGGRWDKTLSLASLRLILDKYLGRPPDRFSYQGQRYTPQTFLSGVLRFDPSAYVELMSTKKIPFWTRGEFEVQDNWWHSRDYHNVPLADFYRLIKGAITRGYGVATGGDVSEPGKNPFKDAAVIPSYDIPQSHINQDSREYRIAHGVTTDDHGIHLVGFAKHGGRDWFLIKDSGRSARWGKAKGYYYYRDDFIRLKMLSATVHKDVLGPALLRRFRPAPATKP